ncbi:hypothetical protein CLIB1444_08S02718 [[Candida] jaroonii]|uniref:Uncharacterized protein n=1 Tax=[Candida] jaroonii TaxID=467808 RepID=A0ACA9YC00_9ASCO|nr:hypothetical protein CLIB1444_08S02718 [[Candida] jaroonii]
MSNITEKKVLPPFSQLMEMVPHNEAVNDNTSELTSQLPRASNLTQFSLNQFASSHPPKPNLSPFHSQSNGFSPRTVYHPNPTFKAVNQHLKPSHGHSKSLPTDPFKNNGYPVQTLQGNSNPFLRPDNSYMGPHPSSYQFPPPKQTQNGTIPNPENVRQLTSNNQWDPRNTITTMSRMVPTFKEIVDGLGAVQTVFNYIQVNNVPHPSSTGQILVDGRKYETAFVKDQILSIPLEAMNNLEFFLNLNSKFIRQLRNDQAYLLRESTISSQNLAIHLRSRSFPQAYNQYPPIPNFYYPVQSMRSFNEESKNSSISGSLSVASSPGKRSKSSSRSPDRNGSSRKKRKATKLDKKLDSPIECKHCGSENTPEWRRGPEGEKTVCNACGIFYSKLIKKYETPAEAARIMSERKQAGLAMDRHV